MEKICVWVAGLLNKKNSFVLAIITYIELRCRCVCIQFISRNMIKQFKAKKYFLAQNGTCSFISIACLSSLALTSPLLILKPSLKNDF